MESRDATANETKVRKDVDTLSEWLKKQPHLPRNVDEKIIKSVLYHCKGNVSKTKEKLDNYFSARTKLPRVFKDRDPTSEAIRLSAKRGLMFAHLPQRTDDGALVFVCRVGPNPDHLNCSDLTKRLFMTFDKLLLLENLAFTGIVAIFDFTDYKLQHFIVASSHLRSIMTIVEKVYPFRVKSFHCINSPTFIDIIVKFLKTFSPSKFRNRFVVHTSNLDNLYKITGRKILPRDFGGEEKSVEELNALQQQELETLKNWFSKQENICSNEDLRLKKFVSFNSDFCGTDGTFSDLQID